MPTPTIDSLAADLVKENPGANATEIRDCVALFVRDRDSAVKQGDTVRDYAAQLQSCRARWADAVAAKAGRPV